MSNETAHQHKIALVTAANKEWPLGRIGTASSGSGGDLGSVSANRPI
ncbi:hypothetical protein ACU686_03580 [Yinghuangia aomiensis]